MARTGAGVDGGVPSVELAAALVRIVAVFGPVARAALESWHLEVEGDQRAAVAWLLAHAFVVEHEGRVELRGLVGKTRKPLSGAQVEAIESAVRLAVSAVRAPEPSLFREMMAEAGRGLAAAVRADTEKKGGR